MLMTGNAGKKFMVPFFDSTSSEHIIYISPLLNGAQKQGWTAVNVNRPREALVGEYVHNNREGDHLRS